MKLRTPITYYGGKQTMASAIISLIPGHKVYCEPFVGGGAVFFAKKPSHTEVLNDTNGELMNFYRVLQRDFAELHDEVSATLHSRDIFRKAAVVNSNPDMFSEVKRAWAIWVISSQAFSSKMNAAWGFTLKNNKPREIQNKIARFTGHLALRMQNCQLECADALYVIRSRDSADSFFYLDPPYFNSDMGHYDGYSEQDFENLLQLASTIKGKFLLSTYPSPLLDTYTERNNWHSREVELFVKVLTKSGKPKRKTEVLTANYPIDQSNEIDFAAGLL